MNEAERELRERLKAAPTDAGTLRELASQVGARRDGKREAVELWRRYVTAVEAAGRAEAMLALARAQIEARQPEDAIETLRRCTGEAPENAEPFDLLGELLRGSGDPAGAERALRRAIELNPAAIRPRLALVHCLDELGRRDEADAELEAVRARGAGDPAVSALVMELMQRRA